MSRIVDKRNVDIMAVSEATTGAEIQLYRRGSFKGVVSGNYTEKIAVPTDTGAVTEHITSPDMLAVVNTSYPPVTVRAYRNGVEVLPDEINLGGDTYRVWAFKSQDFLLFKVSD